MIVIVLGLPGAGKTYFAKALASRLQWPHLNTDQVRALMQRRGQYSTQSKGEIYEELCRRVKAIIDKHGKVIIDATFSKEKHREQMQRMAVAEEVPIKCIEVVADPSCIRDRLKMPRSDSEADFEIYKKIKSEYDPIRMARLVLSSDQIPLETMIERTLNYLQVTY